MQFLETRKQNVFGVKVTPKEEQKSGVYFDTNKFNINDDSKEELDKLIGVFKEYPETNILVVGHTDNVGAEDYNMKLSKNRANSVTKLSTNNTEAKTIAKINIPFGCDESNCLAVPKIKYRNLSEYWKLQYLRKENFQSISQYNKILQRK